MSRFKDTQDWRGDGRDEPSSTFASTSGFAGGTDGRRAPRRRRRRGSGWKVVVIVLLAASAAAIVSLPRLLR